MKRSEACKAPKKYKNPTKYQRMCQDEDEVSKRSTFAGLPAHAAYRTGWMDGYARGAAAMKKKYKSELKRLRAIVDDIGI